MWKRRGIGPAYAKKLLRAFGEKGFDVIQQPAPRLLQVSGMAGLRCQYSRQWHSQGPAAPLVPNALVHRAVVGASAQGWRRSTSSMSCRIHTIS